MGLGNQQETIECKNSDRVSDLLHVVYFLSIMLQCRVEIVVYKTVVMRSCHVPIAMKLDFQINAHHLTQTTHFDSQV